MAVPRIALLRTRDFASLEITFANLDVVQGGGQQARLVRSDPNADAFLIINLSPQSLPRRPSIPSRVVGCRILFRCTAPGQPGAAD